mgnify:CR=1 FL=1
MFNPKLFETEHKKSYVKKSGYMGANNILSKAKKHLQLLRENTTRACNKNLLSLSLSKAKDRVVVKRHKKQEYLESKNPTYSIKGKVIRFDVYKV